MTERYLVNCKYRWTKSTTILHDYKSLQNSTNQATRIGNAKLRHVHSLILHADDSKKILKNIKSMGLRFKKSIDV